MQELRDVFPNFPGRARCVRSREWCYERQRPNGNCQRSLPLPSLMNLCNLILARHILSKTPRSLLRFYSYSSSIPQIHTTSPRPYTFHIGASWAGKPDENSMKKKSAFPPDTIIGMWRDKTLSRPKAVRSQDAGEDFFFVQEVLLHP